MFEIQQIGTVASVLDSAWEAVQAGRMGIFDSMLAEAQTMIKVCPHYVLFTALTMILLILAFSLLSEGLQQRER